MVVPPLPLSEPVALLPGSHWSLLTWYRSAGGASASSLARLYAPFTARTATRPRSLPGSRAGSPVQ
eukprot:2239365-Alexandrium_andersonii.AAC.1